MCHRLSLLGLRKQRFLSLLKSEILHHVVCFSLHLYSHPFYFSCGGQLPSGFLTGELQGRSLMRSDPNGAPNASAILICLSHDVGVINFRDLHHQCLWNFKGNHRAQLSLVNIMHFDQLTKTQDNNRCRPCCLKLKWNPPHNHVRPFIAVVGHEW